MTDARSSSVRRIGRRLFEESLTRSGVTRLSRALRDARGAILAYHNVVPSGEKIRGEKALHISQERFAKHLEAIGRTHEVVSLERLLRTESNTGSPRVAITFDDAYRGAVTVGLQETGKHGFPVTVFVAPGLLGKQGFWWDLLADGSGTIAAEVREAALEETAGDQEMILDRWSPESRRRKDADSGTMPPPYHPCTVEELERAVANQTSVSIGSHTWRHHCLPACDESNVREELERADRWLRSRYQEHYLECVSYPYGRFSSETVGHAREMYRWGFRIDGGLVPSTTTDESQYAIPRINVPRDLSVRGLLVRLSGIKQSGSLL